MFSARNDSNFPEKEKGFFGGFFLRRKKNPTVEKARFSFLERLMEGDGLVSWNDVLGLGGMNSKNQRQTSPSVKKKEDLSCEREELQFCFEGKKIEGIPTDFLCGSLPPLNTSHFEGFAPPLFTFSSEIESSSSTPSFSPPLVSKTTQRTPEERQLLTTITSFLQKDFDSCFVSPPVIAFAQQLTRNEWEKILSLGTKGNHFDLFKTLMTFFSTFQCPNLSEALLFDFLPSQISDENLSFDQQCQTLVALSAPLLSLPSSQFLQELNQTREISHRCAFYCQYLMLICPTNPNT